MAPDESSDSASAPAEIGLGVGELLLGRTVDAKSRQLGLHHAQRLGDALVGRRRRHHQQRRALIDAQARGGAVGQPALLAHLGEQPRLLAAAAQDVVHDQGGVPVGIVTGDAGQRQQGRALRHRPLDHDGARLGGRRPFGRQGRRRAGRQAAEGTVEQAGEIGLLDVADGGNDQAVAHQKSRGALLDGLLRELLRSSGVPSGSLA